jgi:asparagine synthetase B (glutamine-hydrolysing)
MANLVELMERLEGGQLLRDASDEIAGGLYALFVYDHKRRCLQVAVDFLGCMPVYYRAGPRDVCLSNSQIPFDGLEDPCEAAVVEYLKYGHLPFSDSIFSGVKRVNPGELLTVSTDGEPRLTVEQRPYYRYIPVADRCRDLSSAVDRLVPVLDRYFARLSNHDQLAAGLSGGYDSRLVAAHLRSHRLQLLNFGNPGSREVSQARRVADILELPIETFPIPANAPEQSAGRWAHLMQVMDSLENAHVLTLLERVIRVDPDIYIDGFIGDVVIGGNFYFRLPGALRDAMLLKDGNYHSEMRGELDYVELLYRHLPLCQTHEDVLESVWMGTRVRSLAAGGPVALSAYNTVACPFIDKSIYDTCMQTAKRMRAADRLYRALWRHRFPELGRVYKNDTGGHAFDSETAHLIKHVWSAIARRSYPVVAKLSAGLFDWREEYSSVEVFAADGRNQRLFRDLAAGLARRLPDPIRGLVSGSSLEKLAPIVQLRVATLLLYLGRQSRLGAWPEL